MLDWAPGCAYAPAITQPASLCLEGWLSPVRIGRIFISALCVNLIQISVNLIQILFIHVVRKIMKFSA